MNKNLIALAIAAATFSGAVSAATVYSDDSSSLNIGGRMEARALGLNGNISDDSRARVNVAGKTQISDGLYALGYYEAEMTGDDGHDNRYIYAGVGSDTYGQLIYGKTDGSLGMITDFTDIMENFGAEASNKIAAADRTSNNLSYSNTLGGLTVKANYVANGKTDDTTPNTTGFSVATKYDFNNGLAAGIGYGQQNDQNINDKNTLVNNLTAKQTFASASYTLGNLYVAGLYQYAKNVGYTYEHNDASNQDNTYQGFSLASSYTINKVVLRSTYNFMENTDSKIKMANALDFDATYFLTSNFRTYAGYTINLLNKADATKIDATPKASLYDDQFILGARYDF